MACMSTTTPYRLSTWSPPVELSGAEEFFCSRMKRVGRLYAFLRRYRHELLNEGFQRELLGMYAQEKHGAPPVPPAMLALVVLLQAYEGRSDASAVEQTVFDRRWQMVLDCHDVDAPAYSQGVLVDFRTRLIRHGLDKRLLERTVELAKQTGDFGFKQLRVALDSAPLWGGGRVEDTFNLIAHAVEVVVGCAAIASGRSEEAVRLDAELELVGQSSVKAALDIDWDDADARQAALQRLLAEVERVRNWVDGKLADAKEQPELKEALSLLTQVVSQDLEPDPSGGGKRIARRTARDRRISVTDGDMRHGRKSRSRVFNGYKRHIARELEHGLILAVAARPANEPEAEAAALMRPDVEVFGSVAELHIDRGYLASPWAIELDAATQGLVAKPWSVANGGLFTKADFTIDLAGATVTCPEGSVVPINGGKAHFPPLACGACPRRAECTSAKGGRSIAIHPQEAMLQRLRAERATPDGRRRLRQRTAVEHGLAHVCRRQGPRARYRGVRKNVFDLRRVAAVENLHVVDGMLR